MEVAEPAADSPAQVPRFNQIGDVGGAEEGLLLQFGVRPDPDADPFFFLVNASI